MRELEKPSGVYMCVCVCVTSSTFPNFTVIPLQPVIFVNEAPGLIVTIRIPTQRIKKRKKKSPLKRPTIIFTHFVQTDPCKTHARVFMSACHPC